MLKLKLMAAVLIAAVSFCQGQIFWDDAIDMEAPNGARNLPRLSLDASGNPLVLWNNSEDVYFSRWDGAEFTKSILINPDTATVAGSYWMGPDMASKGDTVYVVYKEAPEDAVSSHVFCSSSFDGGQSFNTPVRVDNIGDSLSRFSTVAIDENGHPIVAFMKFTTNFEHHVWYVTRSQDFGQSFGKAVVASGWSSATTEACDCCMAEIVQSKGKIALVYRDNDSDIRDIWAGISTDNGQSFSRGLNMDQHEWNVGGCPSSGPDAFIIDDTLHTVFMSSAQGRRRVYYNKASLTDVADPMPANYITDEITNLTYQNFPRIATNGNYMASVWVQAITGRKELAFSFTSDIGAGFDTAYTIIHESNINNTTLIMSDEYVYVVWQDETDDVVKFKRGRFSSVGLTDNNTEALAVYPNPTQGNWNIKLPAKTKEGLLEVYNSAGELMQRIDMSNRGTSTPIRINNDTWNSGIYFLKMNGELVQQLIKN
ncbi:MAG: hypothetical protein ACI8ZO_001359 [Flavobacteriales bacterium]|jgi:hypothetical protein